MGIYDSNEGWFLEEMAALEKQLENGSINRAKFNLEVSCLRQDFEEAEYIQSMKDAGRGYLLRDY